MPSWELFDEATQEHRDAVLPPQVTARVAIEAGVTLGWERYTGIQGKTLGVDRYGISAPYEEIYREFNLTPDAVVSAVRAALK